MFIYFLCVNSIILVYNSFLIECKTLLLHNPLTSFSSLRYNKQHSVSFLAIVTKQERKYLIEHINCVNGCIINNGSGKADFENVIESINPNILVTNSDGDTDEKRKLCKKYNIEYIVLDRENYYSNILPSRSSTKIKEELKQ